MKVEMGKEYTTRDGRAVRIYATDGAFIYPVHGAIRNDDGSWVARAWKIDGTWGLEKDNRDLIEAPRKFRLEGWVNVNQQSNDASEAYIGGMYRHRNEADGHAMLRRIACVRIVIEGAEGDGLTTNPTPENAP
jgi:hypothetical protein